MNAGQVEKTESTSNSLIRRAQQQDLSAWERLSELYAPLVYGWGRQADLQASDAGDLAQEVFRTVAARIDDFRRDHPAGSFRDWLWGITRNKLPSVNTLRQLHPVWPSAILVYLARDCHSERSEEPALCSWLRSFAALRMTITECFSSRIRDYHGRLDLLQNRRSS